MHAPGDRPEACNKLRGASDVATEGVKDPHLHIRECIHRRDAEISVCQVHIVDQEPDTHPAVRRLGQLVEEQATGEVVVEQVVLHIQTPLGGLRQDDPGH